jgi:hypothetical protein
LQPAGCGLVGEATVAAATADFVLLAPFVMRGPRLTQWNHAT